MNDLKLIAFDEKDLEIVSSLTQDAVILPTEIKFDAAAKHFIVPMRRYAWENSKEASVRKSSVLRFINVLQVQSKGFQVGHDSRALSLLSINVSVMNEQYLLSLIFADKVSILLSVEALEVELRDLGSAWAASRQPNHGK